MVDHVIAYTETDERVGISLRDSDGNPVAATNLKLTAFNGTTKQLIDRVPDYELTGTVTVSAGTDIVSGTLTKFTIDTVAGDTLTIAGEDHVVSTVSSDLTLVLETNHSAGASGVAATKASRLVNPTTGEYYINWGDLAAPSNLVSNIETGSSCDFDFVWQATTAGSAQETSVQTVKVITPHVGSLVNYLENIIDKSGKQINEDPDNACLLGYTRGQLVQFLEQGLTIINTYEPYPIWTSVDSFPTAFLSLLLDAALLVGLASQQLFAIDTDIPNFGDQGNSFVIQHAPQLSAFSMQLVARLDKQVPLMKWKYVGTGSLHVQAGPNFRLAQAIQAAPNGALVRNLFLRG